MLTDGSTRRPAVIVAYPNAKGASYDVPNGITAIGEYSFSCTSLESITFSPSVTSINA